MKTLNQAMFERLSTVKCSEVSFRDRNVWQEFAGELRANPMAAIALAALLVVILASLLAPLSPYDPNKIDAASKMLGPSLAHPFGTDNYGRDYLTRALYGGRISLLVGFCSMIVTVFIGTVIGVTSGYVGGRLDSVLMRFTDIFLALPSMLIMVVLNALFTPSLTTLIVVLSIFSWASVARITRAETMSLKERDFVVAARNLGAGGVRIAVRHIVPNLVGPIVVAASLSVASAILTESSLSFLGLGVQIPQASWGSMLQSAQAHILDAPLLALWPGLMILVTVLSFNVLGDVLRVVLEPKIQR